MLYFNPLTIQDKSIVDRVFLSAGEARHIDVLSQDERLFFVLSGTGHLKITSATQEYTYALSANLSFALPIGFVADISSAAEPLQYLCFQLDHLYAQHHQERADQVDQVLTQTDNLSLLFKSLGEKRDQDAPDGTMCYPLIARYQGDLNIFVQPSGICSATVQHPVFRESWFILQGEGEMCLTDVTGHIKTIHLHPNVQFDIEPDTSFVFRSTGKDLHMLVLTQPCWNTVPESKRYQVLQQGNGFKK